jgi:DNA-binding response OmpR family regulator
VLLAMSGAAMIDKMRKVVTEEKLTETVAAPAEAAAAVAHDMPNLVLLEDGHDVSTAAAATAIKGAAHGVPIMLITDRGEDESGDTGLFADRLAEPFSPSYAKARIRAAILRRASQWVRAQRPPDEEKRLATLHSLNILDTPHEERFDRITRLAAKAFNVPVAMISLIDRERQWIKSSAGIDVQETPRDVAFCSHVVADRKPLLVQDASHDPRFAENPVVADGPKVRFYAGYPLFMDDGSCVGTLCLIDNKPRDLDDKSLSLLGDMAQMAKKELQGKG